MHKIIKSVLGRQYFRFRWLLKHGIKYYCLYPYWFIDGWLSENEAIALYDIADRLPDNSNIVEIGSWQGKSSVVLGMAIRRKKGSLLYCIDPFDATGDDFSKKEYDEKCLKLDSGLEQIFDMNIERCGLPRCVRRIKGTSMQVASGWDKPVDMAFIDGDHSYEGILNDVYSWSRFIKPGGFIVLHDVIRQNTQPGLSGPYRVVRELLLEDPGWRKKRFIDHLFIAQKAAV